MCLLGDNIYKLLNRPYTMNRAHSRLSHNRNFIHAVCRMLQSTVKFSERRRTLTMSSENFAISFVLQAVTGQVPKKRTRPTQSRLITDSPLG